jgi:hypothetical protein
MKSLAKGNSSEAIFKLLKVTINTQQTIFEQALEGTINIDDIADKIETDKKLFAEEEEDNGVTFNNIEKEGDTQLSYVGEQIDDKMGSPEMKKSQGKRSS